MSRRDAFLLALITLLGLGLRLLVWRWREFQPLGGDEQEYFNVAVTLLRDRQYTELLFMRPPLYPVFLAGSIVLVDSLVQNLRLVQAILSAATVPFVYLLALEAAWGVGRQGPGSRRVALVAATLAALSYTLAANAAELLAETLFLFGLTVALWLLLRAGRLGSWRLAVLAGLALGTLCLVRSVALPLLPLGAVWLLFGAARNRQRRGRLLLPSVALVLGTLLLILPWTARNYLTYGGLILIDTTGSENLWLDNDPAGREAVKAQLFALGDDRLARQQLGARNGVAAISADPARFAQKAYGELLKFFALEYSDDMRARPVIWVRPANTWLRLVLGDALWLTLLLAGSYGLARGLLQPASHPAQRPGSPTEAAGLAARLSSPAWLLAPWALYVLLTTLIFHVELRYRLPLYPALLPFAALALTPARQPLAGWVRPLALLVPTAFLVFTLLHVNYPALAWQLGWKHWHLGQAEAALNAGDGESARRAAEAALALDASSTLAQVALGRAALLDGRPAEALALLDAAVAARDRHPLARVVRGDMRRLSGDPEGARADLAFERDSQQDLQGWGWQHFATPPPARLELGAGLDLGFVRGFHLPQPDEQGFRWTRANAELRLAPQPDNRELLLRVASGRPDGSPAELTVAVNSGSPQRYMVGAEWQELVVPLPPGGGEITVSLQTPTFRPRAFDPASPDGRALGVRVAEAAVR